MSCMTNIIKLVLFNHQGTGHKVAHDITTILNIPLFAWLIYTAFTLMNMGADHQSFTAYFADPLQLSAAIAFIVLTLTHFALELEVVFEDYIANVKKRNIIIKAMKALWVLLALTAITALLQNAYF